MDAASAIPYAFMCLALSGHQRSPSTSASSKRGTVWRCSTHHTGYTLPLLCAFLCSANLALCPSCWRKKNCPMGSLKMRVGWPKSKSLFVSVVSAWHELSPNPQKYLGAFPKIVEHYFPNSAAKAETLSSSCVTVWRFMYDLNSIFPQLWPSRRWRTLIKEFLSLLWAVMH